MKRTNLFLLELVLDLLLFAVCATVCVGLVLHAKSMSRDSRALTEAVYIAQDAAERYRAGQDVADYYSAAGTPEENGGDADYRVEFTAGDKSADIAVYTVDGAEKPVYTLTVSKGVAGS